MTSTPPQTQPIDSTIHQPGRRSRLAVWGWPLLWLSILVGSSTIALWAVVWLTRIPPLPDCQQMSGFSTDNERLYCAKAEIESGSTEELVAAINLVTPWTETHPLYEESQALINRWSQALLQVLEQQVQQGNLSRALELAQQIPERAAVYPEVESAIAAWQDEWKAGNDIAEKVERAIQSRDWDGAKKALQGLKILESDYWVQTRHDELQAELQRERTARAQLDQAQKLAETGDIAQLGQAISLAQTVDLQSRAWSEAKENIDSWAETVLQYSFEKWEAEDIEAALAAVQAVPADLALTPEAQDLLRYGHAQRLAVDPYDQWIPTYGQMLNLIEAIQAVQQVSPSSPFYADAQASLIEWQQKLEDTSRLQFANALAQFGQEPTYRLAIAKAQTIPPNRLQRVRAQTLVSHWRKEIERLEDRPILTAATRLAAKDRIPDLQAAIQKASQIALGRAMRIDAQTKIAAWANRIEVIEDQPILDQAVKLASGGKLRQAIAAAKKIEKGRALYDQAQASVRDWTYQVQVAEDRPILREAEALAAEGSLTAAINLAAQIGAGRALYREAQNSIAIWDADRAYIRSLQAPVYDDYYDEAPYEQYDEGYEDDYYGEW
ncbi:hypothetical protein IQ241_12575 [Romeria aff. gracilis LEGE 07310]|uniref:Chromosome segregation ATPase n=1 Tax=Vasconcelosia minhoensis LEGE 07310 TaxID=915328 RepID=A0A8J7AE01_9CYAN|nr:hypothetical protein [Romeria gracilis]MBE9078116.1 hypothetical protein [Romeria aff. gracilis LEGE 07310]